MRCPKCHEKSEVLETLPEGQRTRRRRRCLSPNCLHRWVSVEVAQDAEPRAQIDQTDVERVLRGTRYRGVDTEALAAALAVDRRKEELKRRQREERERERYDRDDNEPLDIHRELRGY